MINKWFDYFILLVIVANCVTLSLESTDPDVENKYIEYADYIFLGIFTCEMILKIIAMGFVMQPYSYLRDGWNIVSALLWSDVCLTLLM